MLNTKKTRLQKIIAERGLGSRREAEAWISEGIVRVNGKVAELGQKADPSIDAIKVRGKLLTKAKTDSVVLAMNKPKGVLCSNRDPKNPSQTAFEILPTQYQKGRLFCVGRLDKESEGLLILTNDGELSNKIAHPSRGIIKRYHVTLSKPFNTDYIPKLLRGIRLEGEHLKLAKIVPAKKGPNSECQVEVHLKQGKKREIRRLFEAMGYFVKRLKRFQIGNYFMKGIPLGGVKKLNEKEIEPLLKK